MGRFFFKDGPGVHKEAARSMTSNIPSEYGIQTDWANFGRVAIFATHDLNNLLQAALLNLEIAQSESPHASAPLEQAIETILMARSLTAQMLALTCSDRVNQETIDLVAGVRRNGDALRRLVPRRIATVLDLPEAMLCVRVDLARLGNSLLNLILNSVDAIGDHEGIIKISVKLVADHVCIEVEDDGCGMDESTLELATTPFYTTKKHGRGLGLSSVRDNVQSDGGEISIESRVGSGTCVRIRYPAVTDVPIPSAPERKPFQTTRRSHRILVVEDDPFLRQTLAATLGRMGLEPFCAPSGEESLSLLRSVGNFWCALIDLSLAGNMDGFALMDAVRDMAPEVRVVLMSGYDLRTELQRHARSAPPDGILRKPFSTAEFQDEFRRLLG